MSETRAGAIALPGKDTALRGYLYLFIATVLWSTAEIATRTVVADTVPAQVAAVRFVFGAALLAPLLPRELRRRNLRLNRNVFARAALLAVFGVFLNSLCFQYSLEIAGAATVGAVYGISPVIVMLLAAIILGDRLTLPKTFGVLLGFSGIVALALSKESATFSLAGFGLAILAACSFALFTVLMKRLAGDYAGLPITVLSMIIGSVYLCTVVILQGDWESLMALPRAWQGLLYLAVFATGLAYFFYCSGLDLVPATNANSMILIKPPLATCLAIAILGEPLTWNLMLAVPLITLGLTLVLRPMGTRIQTSNS